MLLTIYDIENNISKLKDTLQNYCQPLEDFFISQILVPSEEGINLKLKEFNQEHAPLTLNWVNVKNFTPAKTHLEWSFPFSWTYYYPLRTINTKQFGYFEITGSFFQNHDLVFKIGLRILLLILFYSLICIVLYPLSKTIPKYIFIEPINNLLSLLKNFNSDKLSTTSAHFKTEIYEIDEIKNKIISLFLLIENNSRKAALGELAAQVAHDIRSPLAALNIITKDLNSLPEDRRLIIRNATNRINDIANNLITSYKENPFSHSSDAIQIQPELIHALLESIISEKRIIFRGNNIQIIEDIDEDSYSAFANISSIEFKRVASNIINNAIEAIDEVGCIHIKMESLFDNIKIIINDSGRGILQEVIPNITKPGFTYRKEGSGLGLFHALNQINAWGGNIDIASQLGHGTTITITLPRCQHPQWFAEKISLFANSTIIILDDDESIHQVWKQRFCEIQKKETCFQFEIVDYYTYIDLLDQHATLSQKNIFYLIDYELIGQNKNGMDIIEQLKINHKSYLVTSRYDDVNIKSRCENLKLKIIPKSYSVHIPISISISIVKMKEVDLILIDDDKLISSAWQMRAKEIDKQIAIYHSAEEFISEKNIYKMDTPIYIDSNLGENIKGELIAKEIYEMGFTTIYLATGYPKNNYPNIPWVIDILGKYPPY